VLLKPEAGVPISLPGGGVLLKPEAGVPIALPGGGVLLKPETRVPVALPGGGVLLKAEAGLSLVDLLFLLLLFLNTGSTQVHEHVLCKKSSLDREHYTGGGKISYLLVLIRSPDHACIFTGAANTTRGRTAG
jgi:hypothetical protein